MFAPKPLALATVQTMLLLADVAWGQCAGKGVDRNSYSYEDNVPPSSSSPLNDVGRTPMFVSLSFDDNGSSGLNGVDGGMDWVVQMLKGRSHPNGDPVLATFFHTTVYIEKYKREGPVYVKKAWHDAKEAGHEVALHSHTHPRGGDFSEAQWANEIQLGKDWLTKPFGPSESVNSPDSSKGIGAALAELNGWRTPYLDYNADTMRALKSQGVWYDSSLQDGYQSKYDGSNYNWPHTLDGGSPAGTHAGLWEVPVHPFIVPPDSELPGSYGIPKGLRAKCKNIQDYFDVNSGKITGFDYNLIVTFQITKKEFLATLKYSFDLRYNGNKAPFVPGLHSDYYSESYTSASPSTPKQRREALTEFVDYVLTKTGVRMVPIREVFHWMRDPIPVGCFGTSGGPGPSPPTPAPPTPAPPTPAPPTPAPPSSCPNGLLPLWYPDCRSSPNCCASGYCYEKNQWWASCKETCVPGEKDSYDNLPWSCNNLTTGGRRFLRAK